MHQDSPDAKARWYATRRFRVAALCVLGVVAAGEGYFAIFVRENDFGYHRNAGGFLLEGDPYRTSGNCYPLGRVLMNVPLALVNVYVARAACYLLALAALWACFRIWNRMADAHTPRPWAIACAAGIFSAALVFPYVIRDLDECGLQIFLLFLLSAAGLALHQGRTGWAGFWLGTAITYKITPVICLPLLLWKRRWRAAAWTTVFVVAWNALPVAVLGWDSTVRCHQEWWRRTSSVASDAGAYPSVQGFEPSQPTIEEAKPQNISLKAALARYLETYPPGHPLFLDHPAFFQFGALEPRAAKLAVNAALALLACVLAWRYRRQWAPSGAESSASTESPGSSELPAEWAAVCLLCAILSPFCWKQHLVLVLPAIFLTVRCVLGAAVVPRWRIAALTLIGLIVLLSRRGVTGYDLSILLLSYKVDTVAMMLALCLVLTLPSMHVAASLRDANTSLGETRPHDRPNLRRPDADFHHARA